MKKTKRIIVCVLSALLVFSFSACGDKSTEPKPEDGIDYAAVQTETNAALAELSDEEFTLAQLAGVDNLGREVSPLVGLNDKYVGLFYFVATGYTGDQDGNKHDKIYDISKLLEKYPADEYPINASPITALSSDKANYKADESPEGKAHFWGEPLYGYYRSDDEWVIRKHLELFMNAGIDFLYLDFTNDIVYPEATLTLLNVIKEMQAEGYTPPLVTAFFCATNPSRCTYGFERLLKAFFADDTYDGCWFRGDKEMNPEQLPIFIGNFSQVAPNHKWRTQFCLLDEQWPGTQFNADAIPWMDYNYPQKNHNGVMNVSVAQGGSASSEAYYNKQSSYKARGYDFAKFEEHGYDEEGVMKGTNFDWQWKNVHENAASLKMLTVTGWNEWRVTKLTDTDGAAASSGRASFIDSFDMAYSRDIEMMKGGYGDNYYMQLVENIRKFKGETVEHSDNVAKFEQATPASLTSLDIWETSRKYLDMGLATVERNHTAVDRNIAYTDTTNRNDIEYVQMRNDSDNLYVAVTCRDDIDMPESSAADKSNWMNLYLSSHGSGWQGYDFIVRGNPSISGETDIVSLAKDGNATVKGKVRFAVSGKTIVYSIPLDTVGASANKVIGVKATDNLQKECDADEFMLHGDCAPMGRLNFAYKVA